ncbi:MAG: ATP-binding cassette domain-containing protein [Chitinophagaceae bacterium]|nr:ATP-binding cassette domain-containing protein [Chitinophagaceae bacterium]
MKINIKNLGKRFNREWIFKNLDHEFVVGRSYAITGANGSGKSTLLQVISGAMIYNEGSIHYYDNDTPVAEQDIFKFISITAPYFELVEEMTLSEFLSFHSHLKSWLPGMSSELIISILGLENASNKQLRYFSSGMKQRVKLAQAIFSNVPVLLLDEPATNLDNDGIALYHQLINRYCKKRLLIISSNDKQEYEFCDETIDMMNIKMVTQY